MGKILIVNTGPAADERFKVRAMAAADRVAEYNLSAVYVCPVPGAEETAHIIGGPAGIPVMAFPGPGPSAASPDLDVIDAALRLPPCGGEEGPMLGPGIEELRGKIDTALGEIAEKHKKESVAVISSRALTVVMILHLLHMHSKHFSQIAQDEGAINLFEVRGGVPSALYINDTCHLHGLI